MKKLLVFLMAIMLCASMAFADTGTVKVTSDRINGGEWEVFHFAYIANTGGVVPATSTTVTTCGSRKCYPYSKAGFIMKVVSIPGSPNPATAFDITITDDVTGADLLGGEGADFSNTTAAEITTKPGGGYLINPVYNSFTVNWSNVDNALAAGTIDVLIFY